MIGEIMYRLFIDDERFPVVEDDWVIARSSEEAFHLIVSRGIPVEISFDHDLGGEDISPKFAWDMINYMMDMDLKFPKGFSFYVHSQNPIGASTIRNMMQNAVDHIGIEN